ncbi:hypothetical protein jhhlp_007507 [Lomentospora prolificans]|uniref:Uncharacterized protein n=1 Tax=Lomentospora prolificans TaxID=41688 RepID=A0A2N3N188_9PEZI|nr:hypothetical protein jhhlp_007507 [Lomentospora prolificans]
MRVQTLRILLLSAAFFFSIGSVEARRGGGSSSDGDSGGGGDFGDDDDSGSGSSSGGSSEPCVSSGSPLITDLDVTRFDNYTEDPTFGGAYYFGEASFNYTTIEEEEGDCKPVASAKFPTRLYAVAFIAPQSPWPTGASNDYVIGFKGWVPGRSDQDFEHSFDRCTSTPNTIFFRTSSWFSYIYPNTDKKEIRDSVPLTFSSSSNSSAALFTGTYEKAPQDKWHNISLAQWTADRFTPPEGLCRGDSNLDNKLPSGTLIKGSVSADTFTMSVSGIQDKVIFSANVSFTIDFKGTFASVNSTQAVKIGENGQIISFEVINGNENGQARLRAWGSAAVISVVAAVVLGAGLF